ncbi:MAG TPA: virulence factor [Acidimicrobiia bacterium]|nr:virulence factor [Acidimicrobiia bacterium]
MTTPRLTVIAWRDIPAQVVASRGRDKARRQLSPRFQAAIDRAAMTAGMSGTDAYLEQWTRTSRNCGEDLEAEVSGEAARLELDYDRDRLERLVAASGLEEGP